jgi:hypothetical protein
MKTFQKLALVSAIAAAPFAAQADLTPMDDSLMGNTTGQAGVTIEIDLGTSGIKVGSVVYTDTQSGSDTDGGSVALENIGVNLTGTLVQTIDVDGNGDLKMTMSSPGSLSITAGDDGVNAGEFSALKLVAIDGSESEIINNLNVDVTLGTSTTTIKNLGNAASVGLGALSGAGVTGAYAADTSSMAIQMTTSLEVTDMDLGLFGYTDTQAAVLAAPAAQSMADGYNAGYADAVAADGGTPGANAAGYVAALAASVGDANADGNVDAGEVATLTPTVEAGLANGSAIQVSDVSITGSGGGAFAVDQVIWAVGGNAKLPGSKAGVYIQLGAMDLDINVGGIAIGGSSIGSLAVNGLELNGMTQRIYGH